MVKDIFTAGDVAELCKTSRQTVNRWLRNGAIKGFRPTKQSVWRVTKNELLKFMKSNSFPVEFINKGVLSVLIVDDEENFTSAVVRAFKDDSRFHVNSANSGFTAGAKLEQLKPDIVLLDIFLGDMDGRELLHYIKDRQEFKGIKIIGISGKLSDKREINELLMNGFSAFLQKPFDMEDLKKEIFQVYEK